jgi:hypothetical protein
MPDARLFIEPEADVETALRRGAGLYSELSAAQPVTLYGAALRGDALVMGAYQLRSQALPNAPGAAERALRRRSGGATVRAGAGITYIALALADRSAVMSCPPQRLLNRNVRGALQGLRLAGVPANYFGRDFLSLGARPAVYVGWDADEQGRVLFEFFFGEQRSCWPSPAELGYPVRSEDPMRGHTPTTLVEAGASAFGRTLIERVAQGYTKGYGITFQSELAALPPLAASEPEPAAERELCWSQPREESIGFVSAGVGLDPAGRFAHVRLGGDFFAHRACPVTLERVLLGVTPTTEMVARAVDAAYAEPRHDVEGVRSLKTFQEAILDAAEAAKAELGA